MTIPRRKSNLTRPPITDQLEAIAWCIVLAAVAGMLALSLLSPW